MQSSFWGRLQDFPKEVAKNCSAVFSTTPEDKPARAAASMLTPSGV